MLQALKGEIAAGTDAAKLVASMIERTSKLVSQFEGVKKHIVPRTSRTSQSAKAASSTSNGSSEETSVQKKKKRQRRSNDEIEVEQETKPQEPVLEVERSKRKRVDMNLPGASENVQNFIPVALQTEDISEEVNRRLKIKEDMRRKRNAKPEKRKRDRDSLASNASTSSLGGTKPRKKIKRGEQDDSSEKSKRERNSQAPSSSSSSLVIRTPKKRLMREEPVDR
ncbi:uncharacterized protein BDV17DRAFT_288533 [Aspergillus undulatus]|uniref:uncharacterized protein n=1 Tax=Aspergillus undulatus TaxID=1810928 RepID=UPI003CCCD6E9